MFWDVTQCSPMEVHRSFEVTYGLNPEGGRLSEADNQRLALKMQAVYTSATSVNFYRNIRRRVAEESILHLFIYFVYIYI
jgi:hypothetical protein